MAAGGERGRDRRCSLQVDVPGMASMYAIRGHGLPVTRWEPGRALALKGWGSFELEPLPGGRTRLVARGEPSHGVARIFYELAVLIPHFVMERKMLLAIKQRAERAAR